MEHWVKRNLVISTLVSLAAGIAAPGARAAIIPVTNVNQKIGGPGGCSLQEAIYSANFDANFAITGYTGTTPNVVVTDCLPGSGDDVIVLPARALFSLYRFVDDADNPTGPAATPIITSSITILADGATLQRADTTLANFRLFAVGTTGHLTIRRAFIRGFRARGGSGQGGGGGGMGAGGAIYVMGGSLTIEASTFADNHAIGGDSRGGTGGGGGGLGGNGGVGNSTGGGGGGGARGDGADGVIDGGGGGGTIQKGQNRQGGFDCGGDGGADTDGHAGRCPGGGGGGGGAPYNHEGVAFARRGGDGNYGGGGGGGDDIGKGSGGHGGFGAGGGAAHLTYAGVDPGDGGDGGFGGGGGAAGQATFAPDGDGGDGGFFAGHGSSDNDGGGGGAGLGGAIFNDGGMVDVRNTTFTANTAGGGVASRAQDGSGGGGAIFSRNGHVAIRNSTLSGNFANFGGGLIVVQDSASVATSFVLLNTIVAGNGQYECALSGSSIGVAFAGNLIQNNAIDGSGYHRETFAGCQGIVATGGPQLGPLQYNQGATPTMAIAATSPAWNAADPATSLPVDQRRQDRPAMGAYDIGAFELCLEGPGPLQFPCIILAGIDPGEAVQLTTGVAPAGSGTTAPAPGTHEVERNSVVALKAVPGAGFRFLEWSPNVTTPSEPSTTIAMTSSQNVIASFAACACAIDVTQSIAVARGDLAVNADKGRYTQTVTLTNTSSTMISGPISLVLDSLTPGVTLYDATGDTSLMLPADRPYVDVMKDLAPGRSISVKLRFTGPADASFHYGVRVLAGTGSR